MTVHKIRNCFYILCFCLMVPMTIHSQESSESSKLGLGLEIGSWKPSEISESASLTLLEDVKKNPYFGAMLLMPWRWGMTFRSSLGYWSYSTKEAVDPKKSIEIISILVDLKYSILADVIVNPYVSYGLGWFVGSEKDVKSDPQVEIGIGINVGTGFDFKISQKFFIAMEFRYHYVKFNRTIVFTDNYSGPKISLGIVYLF